jgi:hypothetical protein
LREGGFETCCDTYFTVLFSFVNVGGRPFFGIEMDEWEMGDRLVLFFGYGNGNGNGYGTRYLYCYYFCLFFV